MPFIVGELNPQFDYSCRVTKTVFFLLNYCLRFIFEFTSLMAGPLLGIMGMLAVEPPNFLTRLTPVTVKEGDAITLMVTVSGTDPEVTWYREGAEITQVYKTDFTVSKQIRELISARGEVKLVTFNVDVSL